MLTRLTQQPAQADNSSTVELQGDNSGATGWRNPNDFREILTPDKVVLPSLLTWMKKRHLPAVNWIERSDVVELMAIAARTGKSEIVNGGRPTVAQRHDVVYGKGLGGILGEGKTVFAAVPGALDNETPIVDREVGPRHRLRVECPVDPSERPT